MTWTNEQKEQIINNIWNKNSANCPKDGGIINFKLTISKSFEDYTLYCNCLICDEKIKSTRTTDPLKEQFRSWTTNEKETMKNELLTKGFTQCPIDGNKLYYQKNKIAYICGRCGERLRV